MSVEELNEVLKVLREAQVLGVKPRLTTVQLDLLVSVVEETLTNKAFLI